MNQIKKLKCGCEIPIIDGKIHVDYDNLNLDCQKTWGLYTAGYTRSIFQLESRLCQTWSKELQPSSIKDAADLIAIVRPGTLHAENEDGISMTKVFCNRKNGKDIYDTESPLNKLLLDTYSIIVYQEQLMMISKKLAGFDGTMANKLMKSVGKKDAELLFSLEQKFIKGCVDTKEVDEIEAKSIFENIKASARYIFNKSHSYSYAIIGYQTAWVKAHFPEQYICAWLIISKSEAKPLEEIRSMMSEARRLKIKVYGPSARNLPTVNFFIDDHCVFFALSSIKSCSKAAFQKIARTDADFKKMNWTEFIINYSHYLSKSQIIPMCRTGCFDDFSLKSRLRCEFEFNQWNLLTSVQKAKVRSFYNKESDKEITDVLGRFAIANPKLEKVKLIIYSLDHPPMDLSDSKKNMIEHEKELLGINITCSHIERASVPSTALTCKKINGLAPDKYKQYEVVGEISEFQEFKIKNPKSKICGQSMANLKLNDNTEELDVVVFPGALDEFQSALYEGNTVLIKGKKSSKGGFILDEIYEV